MKVAETEYVVSDTATELTVSTAARVNTVSEPLRLSVYLIVSCDSELPTVTVPRTVSSAVLMVTESSLVKALSIKP